MTKAKFVKISEGFTPPQFSLNMNLRKKIFKSSNFDFTDRQPYVKNGAGFTLVELLVVIAIIGLLASVALVALNGARTKAKVAVAATNQRQLQKALEIYYNDMGFYPPDVGRGTDPGFAKPLASNPDTSQDCNIRPGDCPVCAAPQCPSDWIAQVQAKWRGPYIASYPNTTPWGGKYDYNYWPAGADRYIDQNTGILCHVPPGIYVGIQGDYTDNYMIPSDAEKQMLNLKVDNDGCLDGESEMMLSGL